MVRGNARNTFMDLSPPITDLVAALDAFARNGLRRREDLGTLLEVAARTDRTPLLEALSFDAKFANRSMEIMRRIGKDATGYDRLEREVSAALTRVGERLRALIQDAPEEEQRRFASRYFAMTGDSLGHLLDLLHDLSWYKNWQLDHRGRTPAAPAS